jgi:hypothetical protein
MLDLGRFGRAPIMLHPTFFLAAFVLTFHFWRLPGGTGPLLVLLGALVLLGSILRLSWRTPKWGGALVWPHAGSTSICSAASCILRRRHVLCVMTSQSRSPGR